MATAQVHDLTAECNAAWADACLLLTKRRFRRFKSWREPYQLLMACLVYLHNALHEYPRRLHGDFRTPTRYWIDSPFSAQGLPLFNRVRAHRRRFSSMHLASISYRLPLALALIALRLRRLGRPSPFQRFVDERDEDWRRGALYSGRLALASERCRRCEAVRRGRRSPDEDLRVSLALVLVHRDGMMHGEFPTNKRWRQRCRAYRQLQTCRMIEAQLDLIRWAIAQLKS